MRKERDFSLLVTLIVGVQIAGITVLGLLLDVGEKTVLWLIFGAIVSIGLANLRGQAAGLGRLVDTPERIHGEGEAPYPQVEKEAIPEQSPASTT
jgi:hypothetical protein